MRSRTWPTVRTLITVVADSVTCLVLPAWWRHEMEIFSALLAICAGNHPSSMNSPHKGQWRGAFMFSLICARINGWVNNHEAGDFRRNRAHYDVIVMESRTYPRHSNVRQSPGHKANGWASQGCPEYITHHSVHRRSWGRIRSQCLLQGWNVGNSLVINSIWSYFPNSYTYIWNFIFYSACRNVSFI